MVHKVVDRPNISSPLRLPLRWATMKLSVQSDDVCLPSGGEPLPELDSVVLARYLCAHSRWLYLVLYNNLLAHRVYPTKVPVLTGWLPLSFRTDTPWKCTC